MSAPQHSFKMHILADADTLGIFSAVLIATKKKRHTNKHHALACRLNKTLNPHCTPPAIHTNLPQTFNFDLKPIKAEARCRSACVCAHVL